MSESLEEMKLRVSKLVSDMLIVLLNRSVTFQKRLSIEALVAVTLDSQCEFHFSIDRTVQERYPPEAGADVVDMTEETADEPMENQPPAGSGRSGVNCNMRDGLTEGPKEQTDLTNTEFDVQQTTPVIPIQPVNIINITPQWDEGVDHSGYRGNAVCNRETLLLTDVEYQDRRSRSNEPPAVSKGCVLSGEPLSSKAASSDIVTSLSPSGPRRGSPLKAAACEITGVTSKHVKGRSQGSNCSQQLTIRSEGQPTPRTEPSIVPAHFFHGSYTKMNKSPSYLDFAKSKRAKKSRKCRERASSRKRPVTQDEPPYRRWKTQDEPPDRRWKTQDEPPDRRWKTQDEPPDRRWKTVMIPSVAATVQVDDSFIRLPQVVKKDSKDVQLYRGNSRQGFTSTPSGDRNTSNTDTMTPRPGTSILKGLLSSLHSPQCSGVATSGHTAMARTSAPTLVSSGLLENVIQIDMDSS